MNTVLKVIKTKVGLLDFMRRPMSRNALSTRTSQSC